MSRKLGLLDVGHGIILLCQVVILLRSHRGFVGITDVSVDSHDNVNSLVLFLIRETLRLKIEHVTSVSKH